MAMLIRKVIWPVRLACLVIGGMWYLATGQMDDGRPEKPDKRLDRRLKAEAERRRRCGLG
jgi:hypothetical protein